MTHIILGGPKGASQLPEQRLLRGWFPPLRVVSALFLWAHLVPSLSHSDEEPEVTLLPKDKLISLCKCEPILQWMRSCDHILYQALVETLIPDVLRPVPSKRAPSQGPAPPELLLNPAVPPHLPTPPHS